MCSWLICRRQAEHENRNWCLEYLTVEVTSSVYYSICLYKVCTRASASDYLQAVNLPASEAIMLFHTIVSVHQLNYMALHSANWPPITDTHIPVVTKTSCHYPHQSLHLRTMYFWLFHYPKIRLMRKDQGLHQNLWKQYIICHNLFVLLLVDMGLQYYNILLTFSCR